MNSAVFVCTPELVGSWLFYPAWLCTEKVLPRHLVMDGRDLRKTKEASRLRSKTPYDVLVWETLRTYIHHNFLFTYDPRLQTGTAGIDYRDFTGPLQLREFGRRASLIIKKVSGGSKEQLHEIVLHGYRSWKKFGLEIRRHFKQGDTIFPEAIRNTQEELDQVMSGKMPLDPELLLRRYLMKLQVGLHVRKEYARTHDTPEADIRVFDTPEYLPAANLLVRFGLAHEDAFAIPTGNPDDNEQFIREVLNLKEDVKPLLGQDIILLQKAVLDVRGQLNANVPEWEIRQRLDSEVRRASNRRLLQNGELALTQAGLALSPEILGLFTGGSIDKRLVSLVSILSMLYLFAKAEIALRDSLADFSDAAKFIVTRDMLYGFNPLFRMKETWTTYVTSLARHYLPQAATRERIMRQMMKPWLDLQVWYDPG